MIAHGVIGLGAKYLLGRLKHVLSLSKIADLTVLRQLKICDTISKRELNFFLKQKL